MCHYSIVTTYIFLRSPCFLKILMKKTPTKNIIRQLVFSQNKLEKEVARVKVKQDWP